MKTLLILTMLTLIGACQEKKEESKATVKAEAVSQSQSAMPEELQDPEDCDDKIEKLEKEPVEINLGESSDAGCTIE